MNEMSCTYSGDRREAIVEYLYGEREAPARPAFERHVADCVVCRAELAGLRSVRADLSEWTPPGLETLAVTSPWAPAEPWWSQLPVWAQAAAALLCVGVGLGAANLEVRYDQQGVSVRTGWRRVPAAVTAPTAAPVVEATA